MRRAPLPLAAALLLPLVLAACGASADTTPPTVSLPTIPDVTLAGTLKVTANATDSSGIREVRFYLDGSTTPLVTDTEAPYEATYPWTRAQNGPHVVRVIAVDRSGNEGSASAPVTVRIGDATPPTITLSGPASAITAAGTVQLVAAAEDDEGVARVEFSEGSTLLGTVTAAPYILKLPYTSAQNGTHTITARAYDAAGNSTAASLTLTVNIPVNTPPPADTTPPTVKISVPTTTVTTAGDYTVGVATADNVGVTRLDAAIVTAGGTVPLSVGPQGGSSTIALTRFYNGKFTLTATAYDAAGNSSTDTVVVTVNIP